MARSNWQRAELKSVDRQTSRVSSFLFKPNEWYPFRAGQHIDIRLTAPDGYQAQRSYSVASAPERGELYELVVERLDDGEVSAFLHDIAEIGDDIEMRGPFGGHFSWDFEDGGPLLLIGGGSGVAPLMSILRQALSQPLKRPPASAPGSGATIGSRISQIVPN